MQTPVIQEITFSVTPDLTAKAVGSGTLEVLATPVMIANMEKAAWMAVANQLEPDSSTVGTLMHATHLSPTPVGMEVTCRAELLSWEGRKMTFRVTAQDAKGLIGEGTHERVVIQSERFLQKAQEKGES